MKKSPQQVIDEAIQEALRGPTVEKKFGLSQDEMGNHFLYDPETDTTTQMRRGDQLLDDLKADMDKSIDEMAVTKRPNEETLKRLHDLHGEGWIDDQERDVYQQRIDEILNQFMGY